MTISDEELVRRCRARLRAALPDPPATLEQVRTALQDHRGRAIDLVVAEPDGLTLPSGLWLQLRDRDVVWVDRRTSPMHRTVVACHEFGHMVCGHEPASFDEQAAESLRTPIQTLAGEKLRLSPAHITAIMGRCGEAHPPGSPDWLREREAEITGHLLAQRLLRHRGGFARSLDGL
ncbi:ImmA/IrrE family metallo-endopeptidase [Pseudonocardia acidicola]|uniref:IrrE N-terminal-like domain-containing protein n=1 Tax=Pseudonocardia acidicola TaxID=2724939 RepID=A0ABX1SJ90_9PSEU|nr:ImmA/IrrE family metallo-endopeptidase [Pseudonocardia acidicola]NMI01651.1 hypothetical protein [Pseudonocardia acidicola]